MRSLATLALILVWSPLAGAQAPVQEYDLKAELVRRFTMFIEWPETAVAGNEFVIGVVGDTPLAASLEPQGSQQLLKDRRVVVRRITNLEDVERCQILLLGASAGDELPRILKRTQAKPVLTIGDSPGFGERGVLINFFVVSNHVRFEINEPAVRSSGLEFRAQLYRAARIIGGPDASP